MIFDSHAHYDDKAFDNDRDELITSLFSKDISSVINISSDLHTMETTIELTKRYKNIYGVIGVHPSEVSSMTEEGLAKIYRNCDHEKVIGIGEIGLDYHYDNTDKKMQKRWFERQILLAQEVDLPIVIHSRDAAEDTYDMMRALHVEETGGVIHCYSYTREMAARFLKFDFYFGIGGAVTYKNSKKLKEAVKYIPIDRILLETDCPYMPPEGHRGERNTSLNLHIVAKAIAELKDLTEEEVIKITNNNTKMLFRIP